MYKIIGTTLVLSLALSSGALALSFSGGSSDSSGGRHEDSAHNGSDVSKADRDAQRDMIARLNALSAQAQTKKELLSQSVVKVETFEEPIEVEPTSSSGNPTENNILVATAVSPPSNAAPIATTQTVSSQSDQGERQDPDLSEATTAAVPLPAAGLLMLAGLGGLGAVVRKTAKRK